MRSYKSILTILLSFLSVVLLSHTEFAYTASSLYESQIFSESSEVKVKKLQEVFKGLGLYFGEVDGKFSSIERSLLDYQKRAGVIVNDADYGAGYFGVKTMDALEYEFGIRYLELKEAFLKADEVSLEERSFYITAYYSPLPGQIAYTTGSYNAEIRLNGSGKGTASGKDVFMGLLAAPRNYPFGTKIYLEGIGVGEVGDRGGAIVNSGERGHEYDRLDIWVGYGDEGRIRAKNWGTRVIKGKVLDGDYGITIEFDESPVAKYANLKVDASAPNEDSVKKLQNLFTDIGLYSGGITGNFADVKSSLIDYQLQKGIIVSRNDPEAGYFGTKTFAALNKDYGVSSGGLFIEKYLIPQSNLILGDFAKESVVLAKQKVDELLYKMYNGNSNKINSAKVQLKTIIGSYADKLDDIQRREELKYLVEIM